MQRLQVNKNILSYDELKALYNECKDSNLKIKYLAILSFWDGMTSLQVGKALKKSDSTVRDYLHHFNEYGLDGLNRKPYPHKDRILTEEQKNLVLDAFSKSPREVGLHKSNWTIPLLHHWLKFKLGKEFSQQGLYNFVIRNGFSKVRPKKQNKNFNPEEAAEFKANLAQVIKNKTDDTVILYEDEAIVTDEPTITAKWVRKGSHPIVDTDTRGSRKRKVIFGAVNPETGKVNEKTVDSGNRDTFKSFLK
jgi:transposase